MKTIRTLLLFAVVSLLATSCLKDKENYMAGFPVLGVKYAYRYANNTSDTLYVQSYGNWQITRLDGDWCTLAEMKGYGGGEYHIPIIFSQNLTGEHRVSSFKIVDTDHPDDANMTWKYTQLATRGDGSLGNAAMVKSITGSDGSLISVTYDEICRPLTFSMKKNDEVLSNLTFSYNDYDGVMTVNNRSRLLTASYSNDYQPIGKLVAEGDTVMFREQEEFNMFSNRYAFNIEHRWAGDNYDAYSYLVNNIKSLYADSLHNADSLRYIRGDRYGSSERLFMKPIYSQHDNRCQSIDVNQLLLGVERCNPYMLLSLFRMARNANVFSKVEVAGGQPFELTTVVNADKSVKTLTVSREGNSVTYEFEY